MNQQWNNVRVISSSNENVCKYVFEKEDAVAESVLYKYPTYADRTVICCSTQSGCPVGCRFCGAGDAFVRSLTCDEIVSQPVRLLEDTGVDPDAMQRLQIMFMSMGEPLLNHKHLFTALRRLYLMFPKAALLISTIGPSLPDHVWSELFKISREIPTIGLQFSVHESTDAARNQLIPFPKKMGLTALACYGATFFSVTGRQPFFNYCAHAGNVSDYDANRLAEIFPPEIFQATVSVICERTENVAAANERQRTLAEHFERKLRLRGFQTRTFDPAGQDDIGGGCGQLWFVQDWMRKNQGLARPSVGAGLEVVHSPL